jgi:fumarate hydratase subunit alpha
MAVVWVSLGQDARIEGMPLTDAINEGVRRGYGDGYLRKSVVGDPLRRVNTKDNTPAVIHYDIAAGDRLKITIAPKGFGSENKSALKMLIPADGEQGIIDFVIQTVKAAGANPCPPIVVGVGIGGTMEKAALLAKKALTRPVNTRNPDEYYAALEDTLLERINALGIGPAGLGGSNTALGVNAEVFATHIAGLPVAVNINCHVARHVELEL